MLLLATLFAAVLVAADDAPAFQQWCGKYYQVGAPIPTTYPAGTFEFPPVSSTPLLDFRCVTKSNIYISGDEANDPPMMLIDANITQDVGSPYYGYGNGAQNLTVEIYSDKGLLAQGSVEAGSLGNLIPFSLDGWETSQSGYSLSCKAYIDNATYTDNTDLRYLPPNPWGGSVVKIDRLSGGLLVRNASAGEMAWQPFFPFGFYDLYNTSVVDNTYEDTIRRLYEAKELGYNIAHPVEPAGEPAPYPNVTALMNYLDVAEQLGLWVHFSITSTYKNLTLVEEQVNALRNRSNFLSWYVADEPDGKMAAPNATEIACDAINQWDGYHPTSMALNCDNYMFAEHTKGVDIVSVDPYPIALNGGWSKVYGNEVDEYFGCSGCDNCKGTFYDITWRTQGAHDRLRVLGRTRTTPVWIVPQLFSDQGDQFWWRVPTGDEGAVNLILGVNHGVKGSCAWNSYGTSQDLLNNASFVAPFIYDNTDFLFGASHTRQQLCTDQPNCSTNNIDVASWHRVNSEGQNETLIFAANQNYNPVTFTLPDLGVSGISSALFGNVSIMNGSLSFVMPRTSIAGVIVQS